MSTIETFPSKKGEFNLLRKIGEGGMAEVFLAERLGDDGFRTLVALKRLHGGFALDQYFIRQLVQEAKLLGQLQQNNIVRVHDLRKIDDEYYIVMEYIDGIDLAQAIHVHKENDLRFPLSIFFHIALSLCEALEFAHSATDFDGKPIRLIHRDIKPSNVLISHRGIVKLTDFGIARVGDTSNTGSVVKGTANYMSPEQASGEQNLTPASDIFSLGAVFWEMLTLEKLVEGSNYLNVINSIKELNVGLKDITKKGIEPGLRMILLRMLARKRELRYQNMGLVLKDLRFVAEQMKVDLSPSHLRDYMAKITNLARDAAARLSRQSNLASQPELSGGAPPSPPESLSSTAPSAASVAPRPAPARPAPARPAPPPRPPPTGPTQGGQGGQKAFKDSVAALKQLVQSGDGANVAAAAAAASAAVPRPAPARPAPARPKPPARPAPRVPPGAPPRSVPTPAPANRPPTAAPRPTGAGKAPRPAAAKVALDDRPTAPPQAPIPRRPGQVPAGQGISAEAASPPSAAGLRAMPDLVRTGEAVRSRSVDADTAPGARAPLAPAASRSGAMSPPQVRRNPPSQQVAAVVPPARPAPAPAPAASPRPAAPPPAPAPAARPAPPPPVAPPPPAAPAPVFEEDDGYEDDEYDDYYAATRRANLIVIALGAVAAVVVLGIIAWLWMAPAPESGQTADASVAPPVADPDPEPEATPAPEEDEPELADEDLGEAEAQLQPTDPDPTPAVREERSTGRETWGEPEPTPRRVERTERRSTQPAPVRSARRSDPEPEPTPRPRYREPEPEPEPDDRWEPDVAPTTAEEDDSWVDDAGSGDDLRSPFADDEGEPVATAAGNRSIEEEFAELADKARRGRLSTDEVDRLRDVGQTEGGYNTSRALLLAQYEADGDTRAHCEVAGEALRQRGNNADPQFNLEMSKCHLRQGRYQDALNSARVAELHAQDIPSRIRTDRQLKIWEVQAKAYKGLYQMTENTDYIDDSIAVWKRHRQMAQNTYRQREAEKADDAIRTLRDLRDGAL